MSNLSSQLPYLPKLVIVLPCYNEQGVLKESIPVIWQYVCNLIEDNIVSDKSLLLLVDDGSADNTWVEIMEMAANSSANITGLKLTRNFGHQNAIFAGTMFAKDHLNVDICITMDCDLQDDPKIIPQMVAEHLAGKEIVYGVRSDRAKDSVAKRSFAEWYYQILKSLKIEIIPNHADYRLLGKRALGALAKFEEENLFLRGMVPLLGYSSSKVYYEREERVAGYSKYNISRMVKLAITGICSFSSAPLLFILWLGIIISMLSLITGIWALCVKLFGYNIIPGWTSIIVLICFLSGIQIFTLGLVGIYISKIFDEVKHRPKYLIEKIFSRD